MITILYIIAKTVSVGLDLLLYAMLGRSILSILMGPDNRIYEFLYVITEPFVAPIRFIMMKLNIAQGTPIDFSFLFAYLFYMILQLLLPVI